MAHEGKHLGGVTVFGATNEMNLDVEHVTSRLEEMCWKRAR